MSDCRFCGRWAPDDEGHSDDCCPACGRIVCQACYARAAEDDEAYCAACLEERDQCRADAKVDHDLAVLRGK